MSVTLILFTMNSKVQSKTLLKLNRDMWAIFVIGCFFLRLYLICVGHYWSPWTNIGQHTSWFRFFLLPTLIHQLALFSYGDFLGCLIATAFIAIGRIWLRWDPLRLLYMSLTALNPRIWLCLNVIVKTKDWCESYCVVRVMIPLYMWK